MEIIAAEIVSKLYKAYGTDSGILFGIKERVVVEAIVKFTLSELMLSDLITNNIVTQ